VQALERLFSRTDRYPAAAGGDEQLELARPSSPLPPLSY